MSKIKVGCAGLAVSLLAGCASPGPSLGVTAEPADPAVPLAVQAVATLGSYQPADRFAGGETPPPVKVAAVSAIGTVISVDPSGPAVTIRHQPIPALGWPGMTMNFPVAPGVTLSAITPGQILRFTLAKSPDGLYRIEALAP